MTDIFKPESVTYWVIKSTDESIVHDGRTLTNQVTSTAQPSVQVTTLENEHMANLDAVADQYPPLPEEGTPLGVDEVYSYNGSAVMVRQSHNRTINPPEDVPALFFVHRTDDSINWIANEQVGVGNERTYEGETYKAIQYHVTQTGWEPPNVPALWQLVVAPTGEWQAGIAYAIDDVVEYQATMYVCIQAHTSQVGWEPPNVPALWSPQ